MHKVLPCMTAQTSMPSLLVIAHANGLLFGQQLTVIFFPGFVSLSILSLLRIAPSMVEMSSPTVDADLAEALGGGGAPAGDVMAAAAAPLGTSTRRTTGRPARRRSWRPAPGALADIGPQTSNVGPSGRKPGPLNARSFCALSASTISRAAEGSSKAPKDAPMASRSSSGRTDDELQQLLPEAIVTVRSRVTLLGVPGVDCKIARASDGLPAGDDADRVFPPAGVC
mmetsp:Transcript_17107/g.42793  ORF Transcript_17107/g.42793 Transcript_17107/m.42793 type:complete len:226 (+) Transcript_17107:381-1058(+)